MSGNEYVTTRECDKQSKTQENSIIRIEKNIHEAIVLMREDNKHHREIQAKLFDKLDKLGKETVDQEVRLQTVEKKSNYIIRTMWTSALGLISVLATLLITSWKYLVEIYTNLSSQIR